MDIALHVGPTPYMVILADRSIYAEDGSELEGCAVEGRRLIVISRIVEPQRREEVAQHEFYHCWLFHVPAPATEEAAAQLHSLVARQFQHDIELAGGRDVFMRMTPTRVVLGKPILERAAAIAERNDKQFPRNFLHCGECGTPIPFLDVHTATPYVNPDTEKPQAERWMRCEVCGLLHVWHEHCGTNGTPTGAMCEVPIPRMMRGTEAAAFMAEREVVGA